MPAPSTCKPAPIQADPLSIEPEQRSSAACPRGALQCCRRALAAQLQTHVACSACLASFGAFGGPSLSGKPGEELPEKHVPCSWPGKLRRSCAAQSCSASLKQQPHRENVECGLPGKLRRSCAAPSVAPAVRLAVYRVQVALLTLSKVALAQVLRLSLDSRATRTVRLCCTRSVACQHA